MSHELHQQNRRSWNHATRAHNAHKGDQAKFLRGGGSTLFPAEIEVLGDLAGKRVVPSHTAYSMATTTFAAVRSSRGRRRSRHCSDESLAPIGASRRHIPAVPSSKFRSASVVPSGAHARSFSRTSRHAAFPLGA